MKSRVAVVGGGIGGAAAALRLARAGCEVVLVESGPALGGLVVSFEVAGTPLECFYHHVFPQETEIIELIGEMGLTSRLGWFRSSVGVFVNGRVWPFTSPVDLIRFRPLPLRDRLRMGIGSVLMSRIEDHVPLDDVVARDWISRYAGERATKLVWDPLLRVRFGNVEEAPPAAWMWARFRQRAGARKKGGEVLGYLRGGFRQLFDRISQTLEGLGADLRLGARADRVIVENGRAVGVQVAGEVIEADSVLYAGTLPTLSRLVPEEVADPRWTAIGGMGAICVVLELSKPLSNIYWTNICDPALPFGALIEHTNLVPAEDYGGRHVVYLGRYFLQDDPLSGADLDTVRESWIRSLEENLPSFSRETLISANAFRTPYAAPLVTTGYPKRIPPIQSPIKGLYVATTAQIYPQDRGMSEGVRLGGQAAEAILDRASLSGIDARAEPRPAAGRGRA